jgi:hypothetical protein
LPETLEPVLGLGSNGAALPSPVIRAFELGVGFGEAVAQVGFEGDVLEQVLHGSVEIFIRAIGDLQLVEEKTRNGI